MAVKYNVTGRKRKALVNELESIIGTKAVYKKTPNFEYVIGDIIVDRNGALSCGEKGMLEVIVEALANRGFHSKESKKPEAETAPVEKADEPTNEYLNDLTIEIPLEKVCVGNLTKLLEAKGNLIRKALGVQDLRIEIREDRVVFPWFTEADPESATAYTDFVSALCRMSCEQKNVTSKEKPVENEKYAFRCFLLRLGFIGPQYKNDRKILLKNLTGTAAFRKGD